MAQLLRTWLPPGICVVCVIPGMALAARILCAVDHLDRDLSDICELCLSST